MRPRSRNEKEKRQRRESILEAARSKILSKGYEKTAMDDIAQAAGLSRGLLYVYFKDKDDILMGLVLNAGEALLERMRQAVKETRSGIEAMTAIGEAYYRFYLEDNDHFQFLCMQMALHSPTKVAHEATANQEEMMAVEDQIMALTRDAVQKGIDDGTIDPNKVDNPLQTAMFVRGALHGVIMLQDRSGSSLFDRTDLDRTELIHYAMRVVTSEFSVR
ncbi:MAG: TetR/AcrR family transcriptional regulator [Pseudomonadota bacterium]|nr:TetR/AcrR family transcriptional regulator [Pseudomonadota bacterium]